MVAQPGHLNLAAPASVGSRIFWLQLGHFTTAGLLAAAVGWLATAGAAGAAAIAEDSGSSVLRRSTKKHSRHFGQRICLPFSSSGMPIFWPQLGQGRTRGTRDSQTGTGN